MEQDDVHHHHLPTPSPGPRSVPMSSCHLPEPHGADWLCKDILMVASVHTYCYHSHNLPLVLLLFSRQDNTWVSPPPTLNNTLYSIFTHFILRLPVVGFTFSADILLGTAVPHPLAPGVAPLREFHHPIPVTWQVAATCRFLPRRGCEHYHLPRAQTPAGPHLDGCCSPTHPTLRSYDTFWALAQLQPLDLAYARFSWVPYVVPAASIAHPPRSHWRFGCNARTTRH